MLGQWKIFLSDNRRWRQAGRIGQHSVANPKGFRFGAVLVLFESNSAMSLVDSASCLHKKHRDFRGHLPKFTEMFLHHDAAKAPQ